MKTYLILCGLAFLSLVAESASAENVILRNGRSFKAESHSVDGSELHIVLHGGATIQLPAAEFLRSTADEISQQSMASTGLTDTLAEDFSVSRTNVAVARVAAPNQDADVLSGTLN